MAIARALVTDPTVLILDDATSSVDTRTEEQIHATLREVMAGRTTLVIAHRRSTLQLAQRIVLVDRGRVAAQGTHEELLEQSALYRDLLAGPGDDCEGQAEGEGEATDERDVEAQVEAAFAHTLADTLGDPDDIVPTPELWRRDDTDADTTADSGVEARPYTSVATGGRIGPPGGGGGGAGNFGGLLSATPELLAAVDRLPAADAEAKVDVEAEARPDDGFTLRRFLRPYRRPLGIGLGLVVFDALLTLAGPALIRQGLEAGVEQGSESALWAATAAFFVVTIVDWLDTWLYTRYTGYTAERLLFALRIRIFSHLQRLSVDYYDQEMAGRVMTRMTTDVDALSQLLQSGLIQALVSILSFLGVLVALFVFNWPLMLAVSVVIPPLLIATVWFRRRSDRAYDARAREHRHGQRKLPGELVGRARRAGVRARGPQHRQVPGRRTRVPRPPPRRATPRRHLLPVRAVPRVSVRRDRARRGIAPRARHRERGDDRRVPALPRPVLLTHPAAVAGLRHVAAGTRVHGEDQRAHGDAVGNARTRAARGPGRVRARSDSKTSTSGTRPRSTRRCGASTSR